MKLIFVVHPAYHNLWHMHCLDNDTKALLGIGENLVLAEKTLPKTSPTHTVFSQTATEGNLIDFYTKFLLIFRLECFCMCESDGKIKDGYS